VEQRTSDPAGFPLQPITEKQINGHKWYSIPNIEKVRPGKTFLYSLVFHNVPPGTFEAFPFPAGDPGLSNQEMFREEHF
jgi:hypothetical protein